MPGAVDPGFGWRAAADSAGALLEGLGRGSWMPIQTQPGRATFRVECSSSSYFVKRYLPVDLAGRLRDFAARRKPQRAFRRGRELLRRGVRTPKPLGLFWKGTGVPSEALLVTEWLPEAKLWKDHFKRQAREDRGGLQQVLLALGGLLGGLHALGYYHGDLAGNLLVCTRGGETGVYLIDLEELRRRLSRKRRVKNLEELGRSIPDLGTISLRERWLVLRAYAVAAGLSEDDARELWREARGAQRRRRAAWEARKETGS